jgi:hypothetical protein
MKQIKFIKQLVTPEIAKNYLLNNLIVRSQQYQLKKLIHFQSFH